MDKMNKQPTSNSIHNKIMLLIVAYNEEFSIGKLLDEVNLRYKKMDIVVIDDGSIDNTAKKAINRGAIVLHHMENRGGASAVKTGLNYALNKEYDYVVRFDADGQHQPKYINLFLDELIKNNVDWVNGSRYLNNNKKFKINMKHLGRLFYSKIVSLIVRSKITDVTNGYRGYNKKALITLSKKYPTGRFNAVEETIIASFKLKIKEIDIVVKKRTNGKSKTFTSKGLMLYQPYMIRALIRGYLKGIDIL